MLKIGEFSILSSVSIHMLRHYDEIGLLKPDSVDKFTGYRYYSEEQLPAANRILALKGMGLGLAEIAQVINGRADGEKVRLLLMEKIREKENEIALLQKQLLQISNTVEEIGLEHEFSGCIAVKAIPERQVVSYRSRISEYSREGSLWLVLHEECRRLGVVFSDMEYNIAVLHEADPDAREIDVEVQKTIAGHPDGRHGFKPGGSALDRGTLEFKMEKAVTVASLVFRGGYSKLRDVNESVAKWIRDNRYEVSGNLFNIYHISPASSGDEDDFITEVCFPIRKLESYR
jgi:DNA-binding transcriptional MerR regulator